MVKFRFIFLLIFIFLLMACAPADEAVDVARPTATAVTPPTTEFPANTLDQLIADLTAAGVTVVNNGRTEQGIFPNDDIDLWHLQINDESVNIFAFTDATARAAISDNISLRGDTFTVTTGDETMQITWDSTGINRWWAWQDLLVNYWGDDTAVLNHLNTLLGQPFADGSLPYRPEPSSGAIAGIEEYGIGFQYDPYLTANLDWEIVAERPSTGSDDFIFEVMPSHIAFTLINSYASDWINDQQAINTPTQPQILVFPLDAYASMNPIAAEQIAQLEQLLQDRPDAASGALPHLPPPNGQQDLQAQLSYLTFADGEGIRYLTQFNQEPRLINNQSIYYTFQGITMNRAYYIAAFFPVQSNSLPADNTITDFDAFASNLPAYRAQTTADLNTLPTNAFTPDLTLLDNLIQTLYVKPTIELATEATAIPPSLSAGSSTNLFCADVPRPAVIAAAPSGYVISNPLTGEQCDLKLPDGFHNFAQAKGDAVYGFGLQPNGLHLNIRQLSTDGTTRDFEFTTAAEDSYLYQFILSEDGRKIIWTTTTRNDNANSITSHLWQADLDGQNLVSLVADWQEIGHVLEPIRSDGETTYFHTQWDGIGGMWHSFHGRYDSLYSVKAGSEPQKIFACEDRGIMLCVGAISPDNTLFVYTDYVNKNLHIVGMDGTPIRTIPLTGDYSGYPIFMLNGDLVYYTAVLQENVDGIPMSQPGTLYHLPTPYTGEARPIASSNGIMFPAAAYDDQHLIINYSDEFEQWGNAMLSLADSSVDPLQPWPSTYFVALLTAD